ncbi:tRNA (adenosine(37)-N6)-dimethylallyltransferase MiaA [Rhodohalobacter barkolensis]|uniref:tRNA dimethylallyltransferase n=1 Tax=Rhodohalobacter barkolensis TaxID=2053187 RepID=A0A2N0VH03_9BACT|nr:tRNA (adenosine(37)-N6)-dimethylallyltransferase MiaA [Rhodohalobacter barkolensis]PKD43482.1 tRNA (adenosine(37)-N6)-dimethylallyltransferase MiaA [Rhodohalobacter barkolensis]
MKKRIIIAGPTASGKSSLAVALALKIDGEIISVDSRQCYKKIDIGTAKPTSNQLNLVPHHNVSILDLNEPDSVADFRMRALKMADDIEKRGKTVIFCGGSSLHLKSLIQPLDDLPSSNDENIARLNQQAENEGLEALYQKLSEVDPEYIKKMDGMNRQRIIRALDVWMQTGKPFSSFHSNEELTLPDRYAFFALHHPRKVLHQRIEKRTDQMIEQGIVEETQSILNAGYSPDLQALQTVGYKQAIQFLNGEISHEQMVEDIKTATRRYAKRQITWIRKWTFADVIDRHTKSEKECVEYIQQRVAAESQKG